jgi:hypothetical protein
MAPQTCPKCGDFVRVELTGTTPIAECRKCGYRLQPPGRSENVLPAAQPVRQPDAAEDDLELVDFGPDREPLDVQPVHDDRPASSKSMRSIRKRPRPRKRRRTREQGAGFSFSLEDMIPIDLVLQVNIGVGIAIILNIASVICWRSWMPLMGVLLGLAALPFYIWGCMAYAEYKNYPMFIGLFGLLGPIGLIILVLLPHRR